MVLPIEDSLSN